MKNIMSDIALVLFVSLIISSCSSSPGCELTDQQSDEIKKEITAIVNGFLNPQINAESHTALRANIDGYIFAGDGNIISPDYASYKEGVESSFESISSFLELEATETSVFALSIDAATCTAEFKGKYLTVDGDTIIHNGCWTFVFKKLNNEWKVVQENGTHTH